jgi:type IV pilus assembly protein PilC
MANFKYLALDVSGKEKKGTLQAFDAAAATASLREQGLFVAQLTEIASGGMNKEFDLSKYRSVSTTQMVFFFKQLSFMLRAGLPVIQALQLSKSQVAKGRLRYVIGEMISDIENGSPMSKAMAKHHEVFPLLAINLMAAGENTGSLDAVAERLAEHLEKKAALRAQTINAMIYPSVVMVAAIGVVIFLVVKIIPPFAKFLSGKGKKLPASTQFLIDASDFALKYGLYFVALFIIFVIGIIVFYKTPLGRLKIDGFLLKLPVLGKLLSHGAMAEFTWSLSMMLRSGLTAYESLKICGKVISNRLISTKLYQASEQILNGRDIASSLNHPAAIPELVTQMTAVGEKTGTLDMVLQEVGIFYEHLLQVGVKRMSAMVEPAMILFIGGIVGFVYYAFFQAMFSLVSKGGG